MNANLSLEWEELFCKLIFSCRLIHWKSVHEQNFPDRTNVLDLKLDKGRVMGGGKPPMDFLPIFLFYGVRYYTLLRSKILQR